MRVLLAVVLALAVPACAVVPTPRALPLEQTTNQNLETQVPLTANVAVPDNDQLDWAINVVDLGLTVQNVEVTLHKFWHEYAGDVKISLLHNQQAVDLTRYDGGGLTFGSPRLEPFPQRSTRDYYTNPNNTNDVEGDGLTYTFGDAAAVNVAQGKPTNQSSTDFNGYSSRAVDGDTRGSFGLDTVTHTGGHGRNDPEPYWEVDLTSDPSVAQDIGTIRVWNREQEVTSDEIQVVQLRGRATIPSDGTFTLNLVWNGVNATTDPISVVAAAKRSEEVESSTTPGLGLGESMQSKLEGLPHIGQVVVTRSGAMPNNGYDWTITFTSEPGNLPTLLGDTSGIPFPDRVYTADVVTHRNGSANVYYNYKTELEEISGRLFPAWVMVSNASTHDVGLQAAIDNSEWRIRLNDTSRREQTIILPPGVRGRYVRVQLEDDDYLSLAEVEVFAERFMAISDYEGGSPIQAGAYQPEFAMAEVFGGARVDGLWLLSITDNSPRTVSTGSGVSRPAVLEHGAGGLHYWSLSILCSDGLTREYNSVFEFRIETLPVYGTLYYMLANGTRGDAVPAVPSKIRYEGGCYGSCDTRDFGVGTHLTTRRDGSVADPTNRLSLAANDYSVLYVPNTNWLGTDRFTYTVLINIVPSPVVDALVHVRQCRSGECENDVFDDVAFVVG